MRPPTQLDTTTLHRCPHCQVAFRLNRRGDTPEQDDPQTAGRDIEDIVHEIITEEKIAKEKIGRHQISHREAVPDEEVAYYGDAVLIDDSQRRLPRYFWPALGGVLLATAVGLAVFAWTRIEFTTSNIRGTVSYGDKPVGSGLISFVPEQGEPFTAQIQEGTYRVSDVPRQELRVTVVVYPDEMKRLNKMSEQEKHDFFLNWGVRPLTAIPGRYRNAETTPLKYQPATRNCIHDIRIEVEALPPVEKRKISTDDL